jgi:tetratricopeptide (TPR) repeat protein
MASDEWYRKETWSNTDREDFNTRLRPTRKNNRAEYLQIQACHLAEVDLHSAALELLDDCLNDDPENTQVTVVHVQRAESLAAIGDFESAFAAFRESLDVQRNRPNIRTDAWLSYPLFILEHELEDRYEEAAEILSEFCSDEELTFHVEQYEYFAVTALLAEHSGDSETARLLATTALAEAEEKHSGFRYHPKVGLVKSPNESIHDRLLKIVSD